MNTNVAINFQCFTHEQVKEINKEIRKNIRQKEPLDAAASAIKVGNFFHIPCLLLTELLHCLLYTSDAADDTP